MFLIINLKVFILYFYNYKNNLYIKFKILENYIFFISKIVVKLL